MEKLTQKQRDELKSQHRKERDKRVCDRIKAVLAYDRGLNYGTGLLKFPHPCKPIKARISTIVMLIFIFFRFL